jgi:AcrR family transcriptional regulator
MTEIAARSGTAIASLYRFFPSKEAVAEALLGQYAKDALDRLAALQGRAATMTLEQLAAGFVEFRLSLHSKRRVVIDLADVRGASEDKRRQLRTAMRDGVAAILREAIPSLPPQRVEAMSVVLQNVLKGVAVLNDEKPAFRRALLDEMKALIASYLAAAAASGR